jgi:copper homeostasis protein
MLWDIAEAKWAGADGVVIGLLDRGGLVDREWTARLAAAASPLEVTFHRAVDGTPDVVASVETLAALGIDRVLTSGGASTAGEGVDVLGRLIRSVGSRIGILPGGQVRSNNAVRIIQATGAREIHVGFPAGAEPGRVAGIAAALRSLDR